MDIIESKYLLQLIASFEIVFTIFVIFLLFAEYTKFIKIEFYHDKANLKLYPFWRYCLGISHICYNEKWLNSPMAAIFRIYLFQIILLLFAICVLFTNYLLF